MEIIVMGHNHLAVLRKLQVELQGVDIQVQGILHGGTGVLRHQAGAAPVGLDVDVGVLPAGGESGEQEEGGEDQLFHIIIEIQWHRPGWRRDAGP